MNLRCIYNPEKFIKTEMEIISSFKFLIKLFHATSLFYIPWKYQKIKGFLIFSRV